jgi:hypothetical protein
MDALTIKLGGEGRPHLRTHSVKLPARLASFSRNDVSGWTLVIFLILMFVFFVLPMCSAGSHSNKTDGVFESATEKLDKGIPLNDREQKRVEDMLSYDQKKRSEEIERKNGERP